MGLKTPLYGDHVAAGGRMVDFGGWDMPLHFGSQLKEHLAVRASWGLFDVSHMGICDVTGPNALAFLRRLVACDPGRLQPGAAQYGVMLLEDGGIVDDLLVYRLGENRYRLVINAGTRQGDLAWMRPLSGGYPQTEIRERTDLAMIAIQGPHALSQVVDLLPDGEGIARLASFHGLETAEGWFISRTGYTGEPGVEVMLPVAEVGPLWQRLREAGAALCGLGCRDTLRLEAGMNLYGMDMDRGNHPLESGIAWTVHWDPPQRDFVGRAALEVLRARGDHAVRVGLVLEGQGVLRRDQAVLLDGKEIGRTTSGTFSPSLGCGIAMARVQAKLAVGSTCQVQVRDKALTVRVVRPPFLGKKE
ncbi:MAG: glycine cleavage system aminomethyltransferase GcvT [Magnetococcales bacterium]|nr:glycine cleavage system aminomethyltransferase GcvT [Magnetococcales bacterium]